jgi:tetratricopeptide (TPR) repeat protein
MKTRGLVVMVLAALGCGSAPAKPPAPPPPSPVAGLRVLVGEAVGVTAESGAASPDLLEELRASLRSSLTREGFAVVLDAGKPHDVVARLSIKGKLLPLFVHGNASVTVEHEGVVLEELSTEPALNRRDQFVGLMVPPLAKALARSTRLAAWMAKRPGAPAAAAQAPTGDDPALEARAHAKQATTYYNLSRFRDALAEYEAAYMIRPDPALLYNVAQCHRQLGNDADALRFYKSYLRNAPDAPNRAEVEKRIKQLEAQ